MSTDDRQLILSRLAELGVDVEDYYKIPTENIVLKDIEKELPKKGKKISKHAIMVDSRQRNYNLYPTPDKYFIELFETHRNVERIELIAAMLPKTEYNVTSENNLLLVTVNAITKPLYLTPGEYILGSNSYGVIDYVASGNNNSTWGLLGELKRILNEGFSDFDVFLTTAPSPYDSQPSSGTGRNAAVLNRIVITNSASDFSIDFTNTGYTNGSPFRILGFDKNVIISNTSNYIYGSSQTGECTVDNLFSDAPYQLSINSVISKYDYNLLDDPKYIIMNLEFGINGNQAAERVESIDVATNRKFAMIIYDANESDNLQTYNGTSTGTSDVQLKVSRKPGRLKALKGSDFDKKIINFSPPVTIDNFNLSFLKYDNTSYNFNNREHMLLFEIDVIDHDSLSLY
jgi:hypothetical protein